MAIFNVEPKRIPRSQNPLLVIGLGGTGTDALLHIMSKFKQRFDLPEVNGEVLDTPARTAYFAIDTDDNHLRTAQMDGMRFRPGNRFVLTTTDLEEKVNNRGRLSPCVQEWWDGRISGFTAGNGAGGIRQVGRLLLFECADALVEQLKNVIQSLVEVNGVEEGRPLDIVLTAGISGGTGSGTFLDLAYLIRYLMRKHFAGVSFNILAYLLMPAVNIANRDRLSDANRRLLETTAYAALKELDFWMNVDQHKLPFTQKYSDTITHTWSTPPFNDVVLLGNTREDGTIINNAYQNTMNILAESVLNFFADEVAQAGSPIGYRSHAVNINAIKGHMTPKYPTNYTYMSIGAASSDCEQDQMILYEAKLTFDRVLELSKLNTEQLPGMGTGAKPILGTNEEERYLEAVLPRDVDYYSDFATICPLPGYFTDLATYPPATLMTMQGEDAIHANPLSDFVTATRRTITEEMPKKMMELWDRFQETTKRYLTNPAYGPYSVRNWLSASANGFVSRFHRFVEYWQTEVNNLNNEINAQTAHVEGTLYPDMLSTGMLAQSLGMWGKVESYRTGTEALYAARRNHLVALAVHEGYQRIEQRIANYANVVLPTFCDMLTNLHGDLKTEVDNLTAANAGQGTANILNFADLKKVVDQKMKTLDGAVDETTLKILKELADASFSVRVDATGTVEGMELIRQSFIDSSQRFLANVTGAVGELSMDQLVELRMPGASHNDQVDYIANVLMPGLKNGALTMLNLNERNSAHFIPYAYVSIPHDSALVQEGLTQFAAGGTRITPQRSKVVDRIYWLNTYNCLNLANYVALPDLEKQYEYACSMSQAPGIHLVYNHEANDLKRNWSLLPSPIPHEMMAIAEGNRPAREHERLEKLTNTLISSLDSSAKPVTLERIGMEERLSIRLLMNGDNVQIMEQFKKKVDAVVQDTGKTGDQKLEALKALLDESKVFTYTFKDFSETLAGANQWSLVPEDDTQASRERVAAVLEKARRRAAAYVLYYQHPDVAEALVNQQEMFEYHREAVKQIEDEIGDEHKIFKFCKPFMYLWLNNTFADSRTTIDFVNAAGMVTPYLQKTSRTEDEIDLHLICPALMMVQIMNDEADTRQDEYNRKYLLDKAQELIDVGIDRMSDEEFQLFVGRARDFMETFAKKPDEIRYLPGSMSKPARERNAAIMQQLLTEAKLIASLG